MVKATKPVSKDKAKLLDKELKRKDFFDTEGEGQSVKDKVVFINRCAKVVKGGRRLRYLRPGPDRASHR